MPPARGVPGTRHICPSLSCATGLGEEAWGITAASFAGLRARTSAPTSRVKGHCSRGERKLGMQLYKEKGSACCFQVRITRTTHNPEGAEEKE